MDIVICTTVDALDEGKKVKKERGVCTWKFGNKPTKLEAGDRLFFVNNGRVDGGFKVSNVKDNGKVSWKRDSWRNVNKRIKSNSFRGFKYRWW